MPIEDERPDDHAAIEALLDRAFGPERRAKTVYRLREGIAPVARLSLVLRLDGVLKGSLRFWPVKLGEAAVPALLLGPIAVDPEDRGKGYARALIWFGLGLAKGIGHRIVLLVGDEPYYRQFGFVRHLAEPLELPGWVDPARFLGLELEAGALAGVHGLVGRDAPDGAIDRRGSDSLTSAYGAGVAQW